MRKAMLFLIVAGALHVAAGAQEAGKPKAPVIPREMDEAERGLLAQAALLLSKGQFDQAAGVLKPLVPPAVVRVYADWTPVPKARRGEYRQAIQGAISAWNQGLGGSLRFQLTEREEEADLAILFEQDVAEVVSGQARLVCLDVRRAPAAGEASRRLARMRIALEAPYTESIHSAASIAHLAGQGLGRYLGLSPTQSPQDVMGPDTHNNPMALKPSETDLKRVHEIQQVRQQLKEYAEKRVEIYLPKAVMAIEKAEMDAGDVWQGDNPRYEFKIKNAGDAPLEIEARPNCGCVVPHYDQVIQPGAEGKIEAELRTVGFRGRIAKAINVKSNDPEKPQADLRLIANILSAIQVLPTETPLLTLKDNEPTVKDFEVRIRGKDPVEITRVSCSVPYAGAKVEPMSGGDSSGRVYKMTLTVQPDAPLGRSAFMLTASTTSQREPQVNITVICEKGILAVPQSVFMGTITPTSSLPVAQTVTLIRREGAFHPQKVRSEDPNLEVKQETLQDGSQYRLTVIYRGGWPAGTVRSKITVETDDPKQAKIEIPVIASVMPGGRAAR